MSSADKRASEKWIRNFVDTSDSPDYDSLMKRAEEYCNGDVGWYDNCLHFPNVDAHGEIPPEFWDHFEIITGKKPRNAPAYFSCA